jgi:hypothetical protein
MGDFWAGLLLGFLFGVIGNILANGYQDLRARFRGHAKAKRLVGTWRAYNMHGRLVDSTPMEGAGLTVIRTTAPWWSANSNVLDVSSRDSSDGRHHSGPLTIDPLCSRLATRILIYDAPTPDEVVQQRIIISHDSKTLYVFYVLATFGLSAYRPAHVLCRVEGPDSMVSLRGRHPHMAFAGMFALGIFVGGLVTLAFKYAPASVDAFLKMIGAVLTATLVGVGVALMDRYRGTARPESFFMYPLGLLVAFSWLYFQDVWNQSNPLLSWGGAISIVLVTLAALLALVPAVHDWWKDIRCRW